MAPIKCKKENSLKFKAEVEAEIGFLKKFPILDQTARINAEKLRKVQRTERRKIMRKYEGPPLFSDEAREAEKSRLDNLRKQFNRESAHWAKVKTEAEISYQKWVNPILMKMSTEADLELFDLVFKKIELKDSIAKVNNKVKENREIHKSNPGNGNMEYGSGTSTFTMGTR